MTAPRPPDDPRLIELVSECIARMEDEGEGVVDEVAARVPELAGVLRQRLERLREAGMLFGAADGGRVPETLGDFRLIRWIAGGGMGLIYEAEQISLRRRVALKLVRPELLFFPGARERFQREVDAVARLSHPGIAHIHAFGEQDGVPYFAMEFVVGASLGEVLHDVAGRAPATLQGSDLLASIVRRAPGSAANATPSTRLFTGSWVDACSRIVQQVAEIVSHAHQSGVLHRDLKPSNVMLTPAGRIVVVDFGLAAMQGAQRLTRTGSQLGSLPYMAPEQLNGEVERIGPATDVYALGVTLYELLSLRLPYEATSSAHLVARILEGNLTRLRKLNPAVPVDLETVCTKSFDYHLARRYGSAIELAEDLERAREGRAIVARPIGPLGRAARWVRRKPAAAAAIAITALSLGAGSVGYAQWRARTADVEASRERARNNLEIALRAVELVASRGGEADLMEIAPLLDSAQQAYAAAGELDAEALAGGRMRLQRALADLLEQVGRRSDAEAAYRSLIATIERLSGDGADPMWRVDYAQAHNLLGGVLMAQGRFEDALEQFDRGVGILRDCEREPATKDKLELNLAASESNRAQIHRIMGRAEEARADYTAAIERLEATGVPTSTRADALDVYAIAVSGQASLWRQTRDLERAFEIWPRSLAASSRAHELEPAHRRYAEGFGAIARHYGWALVDADRLDDAEPVLARAKETFTQLVERHPEFPDYRQRLSQTIDCTGWLERKRGHNEPALAHYRRAIEITEELVKRYPDSRNYLEDLPVALNNCASLEVEVAQCDEACAHYERVFEIYERIAPGTAPGTPKAARISSILIGAVDGFVNCKRVERATAALERCTELVQATAADWRELAGLWVAIGRERSDAVASDGRGWSERALGALRSAVENGWRDAPDLEDNELWEPLRSAPEFTQIVESLHRAG